MTSSVKIPKVSARPPAPPGVGRGAGRGAGNGGPAGRAGCSGVSEKEIGVCWVIDNRTPADFFSPLNLKAGGRGLAQLRPSKLSWVCCPCPPFIPVPGPLGLRFQVAATLPDRRRVGKGFQLLSAPMRKVSSFPGSTSHHPRLTPAWGLSTGSQALWCSGGRERQNHTLSGRGFGMKVGGERSQHAGPQSVNRAGSLGPWSQPFCSQGPRDLL